MLKLPSLALCGLTLLLTIPAAAQNASFWVAPDGSDAGAGTQNAPFATLSRARDAIRRQKTEAAAQGKTAGQAMTVTLRGGTYWLAEPVIFEAQDGGTPAAPIVYQAASGETPRLSGGRRLSGWTQNGAVWQTKVPGIQEGTTPVFRQLWVGNQRRFRARTPNRVDPATLDLFKPDDARRLQSSFLRIADPIVTTGPRNLKEPLSSFGFAPGDLKGSWDVRDAEVVVLHYWNSTHLAVAGIDEAKNTVALAQSTKIRLTQDYTKTGARYYS